MPQILLPRRPHHGLLADPAQGPVGQSRGMTNEKQGHPRILTQRGLLFPGQGHVLQKQGENGSGRRVRRFLVMGLLQGRLHIRRQFAGRPADKAENGLAEGRLLHPVCRIALHVHFLHYPNISPWGKGIHPSPRSCMIASGLAGDGTGETACVHSE